MRRPLARNSGTPSWSFAALLPLFGLLLAASPPAKGAAPDTIPSAVLRVEAVIGHHDPEAPWKIMAPESISATAFVIAGDRLLTNAHVVRDAQQITVKKSDGSAPALATVDAADEDCDLAVLHVTDKAFLSSIHPLALGEVPAVGSSVAVYGYPIGGRELSTTTGIVSRIEATGYGESLTRHLAGQTDAAVNPGNSGGPVVQGGAVAGVAFQHLREGQNIGYFIPTPVIRHFLDDLGDGRYDGFPDVPVLYTSLESPAARRERALPVDRSGVVVQAIMTGSNLQGVLLPGDVLLSVDGVSISDDGTYGAGSTRLPLFHLLDMKSIGGAMHFGLWRKGSATTVDAKAERYGPWDRLRRSRTEPRYLEFGGLLFRPVTFDALAGSKTTEARQAAISRAIETQIWGPPEATPRELVVLAKVFPDTANEGVGDVAPAIVDRVNGEPVRDLADLARVLDTSHRKRDLFQISPYDTLVAIDHDKANAGRAAFLSAHGMANDRSL